MSYLQIGLRLLLTVIVVYSVSSCTLFDKNPPETAADRILKNQIRNNPKDAVAHYQLGLHYYSNSQYQLAANQLRRTLEIKPDYAAAHLALGSSLLHLGEFDTSIDNFLKAIHYNESYWAEAYNLIGSAYRDRYFIRNETSRDSIELSLANFVKASERCTDDGNDLCLSIIQNIFVSYKDLYAMSGNGGKKDDAYIRKAIDYAGRARKPAHSKQSKYHYAMLRYSLGEAYLLLPETNNTKKAEDAFKEALSLLDVNSHPSEYNMVQNSLEMLREGQGSDKFLEEDGVSPADSNPLAITIQFTTEGNKPLRNGAATLIESRGDEFIRAHFRNKSLKRDGTILLPSSFLDLPVGSELFICTPDEYYFHSFSVADIKNNAKPKDKIITLVVPKTGRIAATIIGYEKGIEQPLVVPYSRMNENGLYEQIGGIGIGLSSNYPFSIAGLSTGTYRIELKKHYRDSTVYFRKDGIRVVAGQTFDLGGIKLGIK